MKLGGGYLEGGAVEQGDRQLGDLVEPLITLELLSACLKVEHAQVRPWLLVALFLLLFFLFFTVFIGVAFEWLLSVLLFFSVELSEQLILQRCPKAPRLHYLPCTHYVGCALLSGSGAPAASSPCGVLLRTGLSVRETKQKTNFIFVFFLFPSPPQECLDKSGNWVLVSRHFCGANSTSGCVTLVRATAACMH